MAMKRKKEQKPAGAPEWMCTYGDMVTLLLTFFVLLLSMSEIKKEEEVLQLMESIRQAFGVTGGLRQVTVADDVEIPKNIDLTQMLVIPVDTKDFSRSDDEGRQGTRERVRPIRHAERFAVGAPIQFTELSAEIGPTERAAIGEMADQLRGLSTVIEVRGHCSPRPVDGTPFKDHLDLSLARARAVSDALVTAGIEPRRVLVVAAGTNAPLATRAYRPPDRERNDIVEIIQVTNSADDADSAAP